jgi:hypothetical protein
VPGQQGPASGGELAIKGQHGRAPAAYRAGVRGQSRAESTAWSGEPRLPFRWDLITPDQLGTLIGGIAEPPNLWFLDELTACAGKVLARSGGGDLYFVGRSLDSMFDLLGGALQDTPWRTRLHRLPVSLAVPGRLRAGRWRPGRLTQPQRDQFRRILDDLGLSPYALARRERPATFVDVVHVGRTFTTLYELLRAWIEQQREPWSAVRRKLCFVGVTAREKTSPKTFRWQQHAGWTRQLPARSVRNVSLDGFVWSYLGDSQPKLNRSFGPADWLADVDGPQHGEPARYALSEALAIVDYGRSQQARRALVRAMMADPARAEPWLRSLTVHLNAGG